LAETDLMRTPHITHDQGERAESANGSAIARNRARVKPASNTAELCWIARLPPVSGDEIQELQMLTFTTFQNVLRIRCKTQSYPASSLNFVCVQPVY
jgi:hypothetical protein